MTAAYPKLHQEEPDADKAAVEFLALAPGLLEKYPRGYGAMAEQSRRASLSIPLNIAEGGGRRGPADRARFYEIARGSAHACGAILDASKVLAIIEDAGYGREKTPLHRIVSMGVEMTA